MTTAEIVALASARGLRLHLHADMSVCVQGPKAVVEELGPDLADHIDDIRAFLAEKAPCPSSAYVTAAIALLKR